MKFSDGFWLNKRGFEVHYAVEPYEITRVDNGFSVLATCQKIFNRGMTLGGPVLRITYTSKQENVIKVHITHFKETFFNKPHFNINEDQGFTPVITETEDAFTLLSGETLLTVGKKDWRFDYSVNGKHLTGGSWRSSGYIKENAFSVQNRLLAQADDTFWSFPADTRDSYIREQLTLDIGEQIYGFGEKFTGFTKNGQTVEIWNADGGTCSDQSYKSIPFYVSSRGYGIFVNSPERISFEVASDTVSKVSFTMPGEEMEYFFIGGAAAASLNGIESKTALTSVLESYTTLTGKPSLPPAYTFGLWLTTSFVTEYNEETVTSFIDGMAERDIPLQVFHFDCFWMKEFEWCNMLWDTRQFPDPPAMLKRLKDRGLRICVWINPYIAQESVMFDEGVKGGYLLRKPDGSVFQCDMWQPGLAIVDFTNPLARRWYTDKLRLLLDMGVDCFKTDFGERIPTEVLYFDGSDPISMHNYYSYLYNKCVFELLEEVKGKNEACLFARSATVGGQKFPVHWGGDCSATYASMAETLRGGLSLCASGFGYFSHDISGFEATASPDIYKRWSAFGLLSTHSRLHGNSSYRVPWLFDEESVDVLRHFTKLKGKLMPYIWTEANKTHETGIPMMRAMVLEFPDDPVCLHLDRQYMLGGSLLVSPIFNDEGKAEFYLPGEGLWTDIQTGEKLSGGRYYSKQYDYFGLPLMAKPGSIIPFGKFGKDFEYDYLDGTEFVIYELSEGQTAVFDIYNTSAIKIFTLTAAKQNGEVTISHTQTEKTFTVRTSDGTVLK